MADWTFIDFNTLLPGEPWTSAKAIASIENPIAIAEGAPGAPPVSASWHPYQSTAVSGARQGVVWDHALDGAVASVTVDVEPGYEYEWEIEDLTGTTASSALEFQVEIGGSFITCVSFALSFVVEAESLFRRVGGFLEFKSLGFARKHYVSRGHMIFRQTGSAIPSDFQNSVANAETISRGITRSSGSVAMPSRMRVRVDSGTFQSGRIWLRQRRVIGLL